MSLGNKLRKTLTATRDNGIICHKMTSSFYSLPDVITFLGEPPTTTEEKSDHVEPFSIL